jgi:hypothetical protein
MTEPLPFNLRALVTVDRDRALLCQQPHCGHRVYAKIHLVEESGKLLVLGSDCFATRYGVGKSNSFRGPGSGGGRVLTETEREMLVNNTAEFLAYFEAEFQRERELAEEKRKEEKELAEAHLNAQRELYQAAQARLESMRIQSPTPQWQEVVEPEFEPEPPIEVIPLPAWASLKKANSSFFAYGMANNNCWVLMQSASHPGCFIAPAPTPFEGWDEALPPSLGRVDAHREIYVSDSNINALVPWFSSRCTKGSRIDSDAGAIQSFALELQKSDGR